MPKKISQKKFEPANSRGMPQKQLSWSQSDDNKKSVGLYKLSLYAFQQVSVRFSIPEKPFTELQRWEVENFSTRFNSALQNQKYMNNIYGEKIADIVPVYVKHLEDKFRLFIRYL